MISIVIPVYNEESRLEKSLEEIAKYLEVEKINGEIVIVNDGSKDKTPQILKKLEKKYNLKIFHHPTNLGKGAGIKTGVGAAKGEFILFTDIDLSVPIEFLKKYIDNFDPQTDIIIGTRAKKESQVEVRQSFLRESLGELFTLMTNLILWVRVSDFTCGFKMFRAEAAKKIFNKQLVNRWAFDAESLFLARKYQFSIKEIPVLWRHREGSKVRFPKDLIESFISLLQIRIYDLLGKYN